MLYPTTAQANFDSNLSLSTIGGPTSGSSKRNTSGFGGVNPSSTFIPYTPDDIQPENIENIEEDGQCSVCNTKKLNDNWIQCDAC